MSHRGISCCQECTGRSERSYLPQFTGTYGITTQLGNGSLLDDIFVIGRSNELCLERQDHKYIITCVGHFEILEVSLEVQYK